MRNVTLCLRLLFLLVGLLFLSGTCSHSPTRENSSVPFAVEAIEERPGSEVHQCSLCAEWQRLWVPLRLGMSHEDLAHHYPAEQPIRVLTHSAKISIGGKATVKSSIEVTYAFDSEGKIAFLASRDAKNEFPRNIRIGTFYSSIQETYPGAVQVFWRGYGKFLVVCPHVYIAFTHSEQSGVFKDDDQVEWVEMRARSE